MAANSEKKDVGVLKRLSNSLVRGTAEGADFITSLPEQLISGASWPLRFALKKYGPEKVSKFLKDFEKVQEKLRKEDPDGMITGSLKDAGILKSLSEPSSYKEKVAGYAGDIVGSTISGGALGGYKHLKKLPGVLGELGGLAAQSFAAPKIQEALPNNQIGQFAGNILTGLAGSVAGGKAGKKLSKPVEKKLPDFTHAQTLPVGSPEWRKQYAQELDLSKRDPKSGALRQNIQIDQQKRIVDSFPKVKVKAKKVVDDIIQNFDKMKGNLSKEYNSGLDKALSSMNIKDRKYDTKTGKLLPGYKQIDDSKTKDLITELIESEPKGKKGNRDFLLKMIEDIDKQKGNPNLLNALKKRLGEEAKYKPENTLYMGTAKNSLTKKIVHSLTEDLKEQIPGYKEVMENYAEKIKHLKSLEEGVVGDYVKSARKNPSEFINKIFENPNEEFVSDFRKIISPKLYEKAAQSYLGNLKNDSMAKTIRGFENQDTRLFDLRKKLENRDLQHSLPQKWKDWANDKAKEIHVTEMAAPRGDIAINANRGIEVGDESKLFGRTKDIFGKPLGMIIGGGIGASLGGPTGAAAGATLGSMAERLGGKAKTTMQREQMLTGKTPLQQVGEHLETGTRKALPQAIMAERVSEHPFSENVSMPRPSLPSFESLRKPERSTDENNNIPVARPSLNAVPSFESLRRKY